MVELRKRKPSQVPATPPPTKKKSSNPVKAAVDRAKAALTGDKTNGEASTAEPTPSPLKVGETISLDGFGGEVQTHDESKTTLRKLVEDSKSGVVLFTYPKASTPGCTTQACLFRDAYTHLTSSGLSIYGLSNDSPAANTNFKTKQNLPFSLLCDPAGSLISAIGLRKAPKGTTRGVFVVDKNGKVLAAESGGPQATVDIVANLIKEGKVGTAGPNNDVTAEAIKSIAAEAPLTEKEDPAALHAAAGTDIQAPQTGFEPPKMDEPPLEKTPSKEEQEAATTAADVADTAAKIDGEGEKMLT